MAPLIRFNSFQFTSTFTNAFFPSTFILLFSSCLTWSFSYLTFLLRLNFSSFRRIHLKENNSGFQPRNRSTEMTSANSFGCARHGLNEWMNVWPKSRSSDETKKSDQCGAGLTSNCLAGESTAVFFLTAHFRINRKKCVQEKNWVSTSSDMTNLCIYLLQR